MRYVDAVPQRQQDVEGDKFSMADITVIGGLIFAMLVKLPVHDECEATRAWCARMPERESVRDPPVFATR
ncbi:glutathione S-transferase [Burkholderia diffusa]|uniref:Glutathione S-transferase n=1 Tax=Burkholderia diffusa TaxID=488732 RepID=A0A6P2P1Z3_9BURK|nr:glutathione S-transferase [Burkholderia diffusa]